LLLLLKANRSADHLQASGQGVPSLSRDERAEAEQYFSLGNSACLMIDLFLIMQTKNPVLAGFNHTLKLLTYLI